jgi:signal transduction histidine kinase
MMGILATLGIFIYNHLRKRAEEFILQQEHHAHQLLMQASSGMTQIRDIKKLLNLVVHFVCRILKVKNAIVYLLNKEATQFTLEAVRYKESLKTIPNSIDIQEPLIEYLEAQKTPLVYEELKFQPKSEDSLLSGVSLKMRELSVSLILPCFIEDTLLGFLCLDEKQSGRMYTPEDTNVLATLTNQAALAIDNARFFERDRENQALLFQSATLADMGVMASSMGHQIKNHIQKMSAEAGVYAALIEDRIKKGVDNNGAIKLLEQITGVLYDIESRGVAGGRLIESISKFSRLPQAAFRDISLKEIIDTANDILRFKVKFDEIDYQIQIPDNLPILYAHPILSEVFVNLIDNANDAIKEKEQALELEAKKTGQAVSFRGKISVIATYKNNILQIQVKDNGIGIKKENVSHLFLPFYTTKASSARGTGLGLFVIKKIITNHKGTIAVDSEYMQGTTFTISLPIRQEKRR